MSKRLILILALAFVVGISFAAYAEVQNVKVSGDITIQGVSRENLDLRKSEIISAATQTQNDEQDSFLSQVRVRIDADLTDNVSTTVRLINERDWDGDDADADNNDINLDLAYVTMKEFLYSPLSLTLGRQELRYGNALVVGDPDTNNLSAEAATDGLTPDDLSLRKGFDAMKAVLNYDPLVIDLVYAKIDENTITGVNANDDTDLYGINANYALNKETILEGYLFSKKIGSDATKFTTTQRTTTGALATNPTKHDTVHTVGARVVNTTVKNLTAQLEGALQRGTYNPAFDINSQNAADTANRRAWALQAIADYNLKDVVPAALSKCKPSIRGSYTYLSGQNNDRVSAAYHGWDPMYEDQTIGHLQNRIMKQTNMQIVGVSGKVTPLEDVTLSIDYAHYWLNKKFPGGGGTTAGVNTTNLRGVAAASTYIMTNDRHLGQELDAALTYDYTEDVQFSLLGGMYFPGDAFSATNDSKATELIGSMKVTF